MNATDQIPLGAEEALSLIQQKLDGLEWRPETLEAIAQILVQAGYLVRDLGHED